MKRVLFFVPFGSYNVHNQLDAIFAAKLRLEGADPLIVRCDGLYEYCDVLAWSGNNSKQDCRNCAESGNQLFDSFQLPCVQLRKYLTKDDYAEAEQWVNSLNPEKYLEASYETLPIGRWVISSIFSYFRIGDSGLVKPEVRQVHKSFLKSGLLTYRALLQLIDEYAPEAMFIFNTRFAPYQIAYEVSQRLGIEEITHERGLYNDSFILLNNSSCVDTKPIFEICKAWKDERLSAKQLEMSRQYLQSRENGLDLNYPSFFEFANEYHVMRHVLRIPNDARVLAIFTSGESEMAYSEDYAEIATQFERIDTIIELYRTRKDYLVIRHHPHMAGSANEPSENNFLTRAYRQAFNAPENVRIIMPSEVVNSYALLRSVDGVISFFSSVGYEAAGRGIGTAASSRSPFSMALRYAMPGNIDEINSMIDQLFEQTDHLDREDLRRVFRFIYAYIYRQSVQFRSFGIKNNYEMDIRINGIDQLAEGNDPELDRICRCILDKTTISRSPGATDDIVSPFDEEIFLDDYIETIRRTRCLISKKSKLYSASRLEPDIAVVEVEIQIPESVRPLPAWIDRSRYKKLVRYSCNYCNYAFGNSGFFNSLSKLRAAVSDVKEEYVMLTLPTVYYDESFVSSAIEPLLNDVNLGLKGVFSGAWLLSKEGIIENEVFTKKVPGPEFSNLINLNPEFSDPLLMCSLTLFRKNSLLELIDYLKGTPVSNNAEAAMAQILNDPSFHKTLVPLVLIKNSCHYGHPKSDKVI